MAKMNLNKGNQVAMANDLIKGKTELGLNELKLLRVVIMQIVQRDKGFQTYQVKIGELAELLEIPSSNMYRDIYDICEQLLKALVYVYDGNPKHKWKLFHWVESCSYSNGIVTIRLSDDLKPYLIGLTKYYTQYVLQDVLKLKSVYSIRLYELLVESMKNSRSLNSDVVTYLSVEEIRRATNTEDKYLQSGIFKQRIIDKSIDEINLKLSHDYGSNFRQVVSVSDVRKDGRKIIGYEFTFRHPYRADRMK